MQLHESRIGDRKIEKETMMAMNDECWDHVRKYHDGSILHQCSQIGFVEQSTSSKIRKSRKFSDLLDNFVEIVMKLPIVCTKGIGPSLGGIIRVGYAQSSFQSACKIYETTRQLGIVNSQIIDWLS